MVGYYSVVLSTWIGGDNFNPVITTSIYDRYYADPPQAGLFKLSPSRNLVLPANTDYESWMINNFGTQNHLEVIPCVAAKMGNFSADEFQYNITIRNDVYFHDGHQLDGWDVAFSMQSGLIPSIGDDDYTRWRLLFGIDDKINHHGNHSILVEDKDSDGFYEYLSFNFVKQFPPFPTEILDNAILPEHILGDPINHGFLPDGTFDPNSKWKVAPCDWNTHSYNTGQPTDPGGLKGPIGAGPLIFKDYDANTHTITFEKFDKIRWDNNSKAWINDSNVGYFEFNENKWIEMPSVVTIVVMDEDTAISSLKSSDVQIILDPQYLLQDRICELRDSQNIQIPLTAGSGWHGLYMNPKYEQDGIKHLDKKGVRHAISHIIPRTEIITSLLKGLAYPAYSPLNPNSYAYIPETDFLIYKKGVTASDGISTPEATSQEAYDEFSLDIALNWLKSEGYDTTTYQTDNKSSTFLSPGFQILLMIQSIIVLFTSRKSRLGS